MTLPRRSGGATQCPPEKQIILREVEMSFSKIGRVAVACTFLMGCGGPKNGLTLVDARGIVKLDGKPVEGATVRFLPQRPAGTTKFVAEESIAITGSDGSYVLKAVHEGNGKGAMPGPHKVVINKQMMKDGTELPKGDIDYAMMAHKIKEIFPPTASDESQSTLTATVPPTGGTFDFDVESAP